MIPLKIEIQNRINIPNIDKLDLLTDSEYYKFKFGSKGIIYTASSEKLNFKFEKKIRGIPILFLKEQKFQMLPGILPFLNQNFSKLVLTTNLIDAISRGKAVKIKKKDGFYLVNDSENRLFAFAIQKDNVLSPIVDLGWYLRNDNFYQNIL